MSGVFLNFFQSCAESRILDSHSTPGSELLTPKLKKNKTPALVFEKLEVVIITLLAIPASVPVRCEKKLTPEPLRLWLKLSISCQSCPFTPALAYFCFFSSSFTPELFILNNLFSD